MSNLFEHAEKYPREAGYAKGSETSREASEKLTSKQAISDAVLRLVDGSGAFGITVDDAREKIEVILNKKFERSTIGARFTELSRLNIIRIAGKRDNGKGRNVNYYITN